MNLKFNSSGESDFITFYDQYLIEVNDQMQVMNSFGIDKGFVKDALNGEHPSTLKSFLLEEVYEKLEHYLTHSLLIGKKTISNYYTFQFLDETYLVRFLICPQKAPSSISIIIQSVLQGEVVVGKSLFGLGIKE